MAFIPQSGSVVAFQSDPTKLQVHASVSGTVATTPTQGTSISGTIDLGIAGTGATSLGKAEDTAHSSGDTGVQILGVRRDSPLDGPFAGADGDYEPLSFTNQRALVSPNLVQLVDNFSDHTSWAAVNDDAGNIVDETVDYLAGGSAVQFDKLDGTSNTTYGLISKTLGSTINFLNGITGAAFWQLVMKIPDVVDVTNVVIRAGTDASNYGEWLVPVDVTITNDEFHSFRIPITRQTSATGTGWSGSAVDYFAVGLQFGAQGDTLAGIVVDALIYNGGNIVEADITSETSVDTANVNVQKMGNQTVSMNTGNAGNGTQRVVLANDTPATSAFRIVTGKQKSQM